MPELIRLDLEFLKYEQIAEKAEAFLARLGRAGALPVDVDAIAEFDLGLDIVPLRGLQDLDTEAFTSSDMTRVCIDEWVYANRPTRARFSLAHELGHVVLHKSIFERFTFDSIGDWQAFHLAVDPDDYAWLERQANNFAGLILVPRRHLDRVFRAALSDLVPHIERAKRQGFNREDYLEYALAAISERLAPAFDVSAQVLQIRIRKDGLDALL